ncbi:MAG TPA: MBL fold metallo-hydrolase [Opitutaceae bacterium]|nr:MBL fold metallo-hydrolase [Opitutaceae bacterium]
MNMRVASLVLLGGLAGVSLAPVTFAVDQAAEKNLTVEKTAGGDLGIQPINHSALRFEYRGRQYYVDPAGRADWANLPKADAIFITHEHGDHLSPPTIALLKKEGTLIFANASSVKEAGLGTVIEVGEKKSVFDIVVEAVPAYNLTPDRLQFHPKARKDNGYVLTFGGKRVYVAGDTEGTPEMKALQHIDIAFLPINLPYTMLPKDAAEAARAFKPKILYPYHQGKSDPTEVRRLLADMPEIEVRVLALP